MLIILHIIAVVQSLNHVWLFRIPRTTACQLPCPSLSPRVCSNSCPLSWWYCLTISSSADPLLILLWIFLNIRDFPVSWFFTSGDQLQHQCFQRIFRTDFLYNRLVWSPGCPRDSQDSSPAPQFKSINSSALSLLYGPTLTSIHDYWGDYSFDCMDLCQPSDVSAF